MHGIHPSACHPKMPRYACCCWQLAVRFSTCPLRWSFVLVSNEVGTVVRNPRDFSQAVWCDFTDRSCMCLSCGRIAVADFLHSTGEAIQRAWFHLGECKLLKYVECPRVVANRRSDFVELATIWHWMQPARSGRPLILLHINPLKPKWAGHFTEMPLAKCLPK